MATHNSLDIHGGARTKGPGGWPCHALPFNQTGPSISYTFAWWGLGLRVWIPLRAESDGSGFGSTDEGSLPAITSIHALMPRQTQRTWNLVA